MNIETKGFIATPNDISELTIRILEATSESAKGKRLYLQGLVATTVSELGATPRVRTGRAAKLSGEEQAKQLGAITAVHERFYTAVMAAAQKKVPAGPGRGVAVNKATHFARSAVLLARNWVRAGHDLTAVAVAKLTTASLAVKRNPRPASVAVLRRRLEEKGKALVASALELIDADKDAALAELELIMSQLATQMLGLGGKTTRDAAEAVSQHKPLRVKSTVFVPTETMIQRQQRAPS